MDELGITLQKSGIRGYYLQLPVLRARTERVKSHFKYGIATLYGKIYNCQ